MTDMTDTIDLHTTTARPPRARWRRICVALMATALLAAAACGSSSSTDDQATGGEAADEAEPNAWDPEQPINLGGVEDVTPDEQAAAETLLADTMEALPQFADPADAEAAGYVSIGDWFTGHEHYINWDYRFDDTDLDSYQPESLVYIVEDPDDVDSPRTLAAAMYMLSPGSDWDDIPAELESPLIQWHIHEDLCYTDDPDAPRIAGTIDVESGEECADDLQQFEPVPMIHVWIERNECGPFAALEGTGGGQVPEGEEHLCDHAHGH